MKPLKYENHLFSIGFINISAHHVFQRSRLISGQGSSAVKARHRFGQSEPVSSRRSKCMTFLIESLRKRISLSLGASEVEMYDFLNRIFEEADYSEPDSSIGPNAWLS